MRRIGLTGLVIGLFAAASGGCRKTADEAMKTRLGPFTAEDFREANAQGELLHCYVLGRESNAAVRLCGEGVPAPDNQSYLFHAEVPRPGKFTEEGAPLAPGWYLLRPEGASRVDAWNLGRLGEQQWLGGGKVLLAVETDAGHTTHVRLIDAVGRVDRVLDAPLSRSESFVAVRPDDDAALLLIERTGVERLLLVRSPLVNPSLEILDVPASRNPGAKRLFLRGAEERSRGGIFRYTASLAAAITWKGEEPYFEGRAIGPFDSPDERRARGR